MRAVLHHLAVRLNRAERFQPGAAGADHELPNAEHGVGRAGRRLRREAFVGVLVTVDDDIRAGLVQVGPDRVPGVVIPVQDPRAVLGLVPDRRGALRRARGEVGLEPLLLGRAGAGIDVVVDDDDVPGAEVEAVVALGRDPRGGAEIGVVRRGAGNRVVVIPRHRLGARLMTSPRRVVAVRELVGRAVGVDVVSGGEHGALDVVEQRGGRFVLRHVADADVAGAHEHRGRRR